MTDPITTCVDGCTPTEPHQYHGPDADQPRDLCWLCGHEPSSSIHEPYSAYGTDSGHRPIPSDSAETLEVEFADMTTDQQCRADALTAAIRHLAATGELPDATQHQPRTVLDLADVYADYIRDGSRP